MYFEQEAEIEKNMAGLLLSAIISDTMNFQSPTTTEKDKRIAARLAEIAGIEIDDLAYDIYFMSSNCKEKSLADFARGDVKAFLIDDKNVLIAQAIIPSIDEIVFTKEQIMQTADEQARQKNADLFVFVFTDILKKGSHFYFGGKEKNLFENGLFHENVLSRKKQILPMITSTLLDS